MKLFILTALITLTVATAIEPKLYISSSSSSSNNNNLDSIIKLSSIESNSLLSHHLSTSNYELLPQSFNAKGDKSSWESLLNLNNEGGVSWLEQSEEELNKIVIILECGKEGCDDFIPTSFDSITPSIVPSLPLRSWTSVLTLHLTRLTNSLGLDLSSQEIYGLDGLIKGIKNTEGWMGWVGEELGSAIGWNSLKKSVKTTVQPDRSNSGLLTDLDLLDSSADELISELEALVELADSINPKSVAADNKLDDGPQSQSQSLRIVALHLSGMKAIAKVHSKSSPQYQRAATLLRQTLTATLSVLSQSMSSEPTTLLLTLPPYSPPLLQTRKPWLTPFQSTSTHRYTRRSIPSTLHGRAPLTAPKPKVSPVIPSGSTCFDSSEETNNQTAFCLGRGEPVLGLTTRGKDCWVCHCGTTEDEQSGRITKWAGEGCEKVDISSTFVLIFFSTLGLLIVLLASVMLLYSAGTGELPGTLASVGGGMGGQSKRD